MRFGGIVSRLRAHQRSFGSIQVAARNRSFGKQLLAALHDAQVQVEIRLGLRNIEFGLLRVFRHLRLRRRGIGRPRRHVGALVVHCRRRQIVVFERGQQLAGLHTRSALHVELAHRRADLRIDGRLRQRRQHRIGGDMLGDSPLLGMLGLHRHLRLRHGLLLAARQKRQG